MTKREIALIKKAISYLHHTNEYYEGMNILAKLVGYPEATFPTTKTCSIGELIAKAKLLEGKE